MDPIHAQFWVTCAWFLPEHVVDCDDVLLVNVLGITDDGGARLQPYVSAVTVHQPVVVGQHLSFVQHCSTQHTAGRWKRILLPNRLAVRGAICTVAQKSKPLSRIIIKAYWKPPVRLHFSSILSIKWAQEYYKFAWNILWPNLWRHQLLSLKLRHR